MAALCFIVDVRTDGRTSVRNVRRTFLPGLLGHLSGDDLKTDIAQTKWYQKSVLGIKIRVSDGKYLRNILSWKYIYRHFKFMSAFSHGQLCQNSEVSELSLLAKRLIVLMFVSSKKLIDYVCLMGCCSRL